MSSRQVSGSRIVAAPARSIFSVLADPSQHPLIDGSGTVRAAHTAAAEPLRLGSRFGMSMRLGVPYRMTNEVVEYEQDALIAWRHLGGHRWRYRLEPTEGGTRVTETFDWSTARLPLVVVAMGWPDRNRRAIERTLERLEALVTTPAG